MKNISSNGKYKLEIWKNDNSLNPFEDWDCEPDMRIKYGRNTNYIEYSVTPIVNTIKEILESKPHTIIRNQNKIADIIDIDYDYFHHSNLSKDDKIAELLDGITDYLDNKELYELCLIAKIPCLLHESKGYSQGDYASVLIILTSEFYERTGCNRRNAKSILSGTAKLFDNWAWGNCYGYTVFERKDYVKIPREDYNNLISDNVEDLTEWVQVDSCGGFFGSDHVESGMLGNISKEFELTEVVTNYDYNDIKD